MESEFFELFSKHRDVLILDVSYSKQLDWHLIVYDKRGKLLPGEEIPQVFHHQSPDVKLLFAKAYAALCEFYLVAFGGYHRTSRHAPAVA